MSKREDAFSSEDRELGLDREITRRDFVNSVAAGTGAALLAQAAPLVAAAEQRTAPNMGADAFNGYAGVGDYARSNGNTWEVVQAAHAMRDGAFRSNSGATETGELFDVVIVGGGFSGMGAAHRVMQLGAGRKTCLVLDNHAMFGGEAKRNEFLVDGVRLYAPQGSNEAGVPPQPGDQEIWAQVWRDLQVPLETHYSMLPASRTQLPTSRSNYMFHLWGDNFESHGFYFPEAKRWVSNPWGHELEGVPWSDAVKRDMLRWRNDPKPYYTGERGEALDRWLDSMSYEQYLTKVMGLGPEAARYADPVLAAAGGLGSDVTSAYMAYGFTMPGFQALQADHPAKDNYALAPLDRNIDRFPGGNDAILRAFVKRLVPDAIAGTGSFDDVHNNAVRFDLLDRPGQPTRLRSGLHGDGRRTRRRPRQGGARGNNLRARRSPVQGARARCRHGVRLLGSETHCARSAERASRSDGPLLSLAHAGRQRGAHELASALQAGIHGSLVARGIRLQLQSQPPDAGWRLRAGLRS